jgi:cellulose synthase/poly-beta-1,6-N-acetylglucosamine synthase-like glycosyltransferase
VSSKAPEGVRVSIVTNVYNEAHLLPAYVQSLIDQSFLGFELIIVSDGSQDDYQEVLRSYERHLRALKVISLSHVGYQRARAAGAEAAQGDIIIILDPDEVVDRYCVERFVSAFDDPAVGLVGGRKVPFDKNWLSKAFRELHQSTYDLRKTRDGNAEWVPGGCMALRASILGQLQGYRDRVADDVDISWRAAEAGWKVIARDDIIVYHREPESLPEVLNLGRKEGRRNVYTYRRHPRRFFHWKSLTRFVPVALLAAALWSPAVAAAGCGAFFLGFQVVLWRRSGSPLYKALAWVLFCIQNLAYAAGFAEEFTRIVVVGLGSRLEQLKAGFLLTLKRLVDKV